MRRAPWTATLMAAALIALPAGAFAQTPAPPQTSSSAAKSAAKPQVDVSGAKKHLTEARDTLSQLTSMPEAAKLQGDARAQVSQLISNFNDLITTQSEWRAAYVKVDANLTALLGPETPATDQPVGTAGSVTAAPAPASGMEIDPAIRAKLAEFRTHLKAFETAASGESPSNAAPTSGAMAPANPTATTANPANPVEQTKPAPTSGVSPSSPTASMSAADRAQAQSAMNAASDVPNADAQKELNAISAILNSSRTGTLTRAQVAQLRKHVETLQVMVAKK